MLTKNRDYTPKVWKQKAAASWPVTCALYESWKMQRAMDRRELDRKTNVKTAGDREEYYRLCETELGLDRPVEAGEDETFEFDFEEN